MSKPLFFTGRKEVARSDVRIRLLNISGRVTRFEARLDLTGYRFGEDDAQVFVESYHTTYLERFAVGTLAHVNSGATISEPMPGLETGEIPLFRVKVVSASGPRRGVLLGAIDALRPEAEDVSGAAGSLLPLIPKSRDQMGNEFWKVHFNYSNEAQPELWINTDVQGLFQALQNQDPRITALILPEILRQVLLRLVEDQTEWTEDNSTLGKWLTFAKELYEEFEVWDEQDSEGSRRARREWVDNVVRAFAGTQRLVDLYHQQLEARVSEVG
jgi:hypothetical protein